MIASWHTPYLPGRRAGVILLRIGLGLLGLVFLVVVSQPLWLGPALGRYLTATAGRPVHFDSVRVGLTSSLAPVARLRGVRIANAPWAGRKEPFAELAEATFVFAWTRFEGRHVVTRLEIRGGTVDLELAADGLRNWRLTDPGDRGPGHYWFYALEAHGVKLAFINHRIDLRLTTAASDAAPSGPSSLPADKALPTRIDFAGDFRRVAFHGSVATAAALTFMKTDRWFPLRGQAAITGAELDVDGRAADLFRAMQVDADVVLAGKTLAALRPFVGARYAEAHPFRISGHLRRGAGHVALADLKAEVGDTDLRGDLSWAHESERRTLHAHLKSAKADLADLLWLVGRRPDDAARLLAVGTAPAPAHADVFARLRGDLDADVSLDFARLRAAGLRPLQSLKLKAALAAGQLDVADLDIGWADGHSTGRLGLDLRRPLAAAEATLETRGVRLASLFAASDKKHIEGTLTGRMALHAKGNTIAALRADLAGKATLRLDDGTIPSLLDAELGLEGGKLLRTLISGNEPLPLACAAASLAIADGRARIDDLVLDSSNTLIRGSGTIDLRSLAIDLVLTPQPKGGLFDLQRSVHVFGRLPKLRHELVARVEQKGGDACG